MNEENEGLSILRKAFDFFILRHIKWFEDIGTEFPQFNCKIHDDNDEGVLNEDED